MAQVKLNPTVMAMLLGCMNRTSPMTVSQREVSAFARLVASCNDDPEYQKAVRKKYDYLLENFSKFMDNELVEPLDRGQEYDAIAWLLSNRGVLKLGERELGLLLDNARFNLVGFQCERFGVMHRASPVWRVTGGSGAASFDYIPWSWQSGKKPQLV